MAYELPYEFYREDTRAYNVGFPILKKLFKLKRNRLLTVMQAVLKDNEEAMQILNEEADVKKKIVNDVQEEIRIYFHSVLLINYAGVRLIPAHGRNVKLIFKFDEHFNLEAALEAK